DLFYRVGKFPILNPNTSRTSGVVTGHQVHSEAQELDYIESLLDIGDDLLGAAHTFFQIEIAGANSGISRETSGGIAGGCKAKLPGHVRIEQIGLENTLLNHHRSPARNALAIKGTAAKTAGHHAIVDDGDVFSGDSLPQLSGQKGGMAVNGVSVHRIGNIVD